MVSDGDQQPHTRMNTPPQEECGPPFLLTFAETTDLAILLYLQLLNCFSLTDKTS